MISDAELSILAAVQSLPLSSEPFKDIADKLDMSVDDLFTTLSDLTEKGCIRRFGPSINHRKLGFVANPMAVMRVPDDRLDEVGNLIASQPGVTHCYSRSGWDYNMFFMTHARTKEEGIVKAEKIIGQTGISDYKLLFSVREFKKTSLDISRIMNEGGAQ